MLDQETLGYCFQNLPGVDVAYLPTEQGVELLGLGLEEVMQVRQTRGDGPDSPIRYREI
jgi:hypothetical protein